MKGPALVAAALLAALTGCATPSAGPTGYAKAEAERGASYGYRDKALGDDEFSIVATGNRLTTRERVAEIALLRAARIAQEHGRTHFLIQNRKAEPLQSTQTQSVTLFIGGVWMWLPVDERTTMEPMTVLLVRLLPMQAEYPSNAVDAAATIEQLTRRLE